MYDTRTRLSNQVAEEVRRYFGDKVFNSVVSRNIRLAEAPSFGKPVLLYDSVSIGTRHYVALAKELITRNRDRYANSPVFTEEGSLARPYSAGGWARISVTFNPNRSNQPHPSSGRLPIRRSA